MRDRPFAVASVMSAAATARSVLTWAAVSSSLSPEPEVTRRGGEAAGEILVEDFVPGREVVVEGLLTGGILRILALFDKPDPLDGPRAADGGRDHAGHQLQLQPLGERVARGREVAGRRRDQGDAAHAVAEQLRPGRGQAHDRHAAHRVPAEDDRAGTRRWLWVDRTGRPTAPPRSRSRTVIDAGYAAGGAVLAVGVPLLIAYRLVRRRCDRVRDAMWDAEWARIDPHRIS